MLVFYLLCFQWISKAILSFAIFGEAGYIVDLPANLLAMGKRIHSQLSINSKQKGLISTEVTGEPLTCHLVQEPMTFLTFRNHDWLWNCQPFFWICFQWKTSAPGLYCSVWSFIFTFRGRTDSWALEESLLLQATLTCHRVYTFNSYSTLLLEPNHVLPLGFTSNDSGKSPGCDQSCTVKNAKQLPGTPVSFLCFQVLGC